MSTAASVPPILHSSTARALHTAAGSGRFEKLGNAFFHPLRARKLRASRFLPSCEKVGKKKRTLANSFSPFQAWCTSEKSKFMNSGFQWHLTFLASSGILSAIFTSSRTRARPRRCKTRARPADSFSSSLLLTKLLAQSQFASPKAECGEGAL